MRIIQIVGLFLGASALRKRRTVKEEATAKQGTKFVAGVPIVNYQAAYGGKPALNAEHEEEWIVMMKRGTTDAQIDSVCKASKKACKMVGHPDQGGVPFLEFRGTEGDLSSVIESANGAVQFVEPDQIMQMIPELQAEPTSGSWGLDRVGARGRGNNLGAGTHIFILDTGVRVSHQDFGDRGVPLVDYSWGYASECNGDLTCAADNQGHGTHCAGTAAGANYGVASKANVYGVKVLGDSGAGNLFAIIGSVDYLATRPERPAVGSMSLGGTCPLGFCQMYFAMKWAVDSAVASGVTVVVAGGNSNADACGFMPAYVPGAITVGATDSNDARSHFSNFGSCTNIWAPGSAITSAGHEDDTGAKTYSGTSMACPHVAGGAALVLEQFPEFKAEQVLEKLLARAATNYITDLKPSDVNKMLYIASDAPPPEGNVPPPEGDVSTESNTTKVWQPKLLPGKVEVLRPAFLMLDEEKKQVLVSQFGRLTRPDQWWNPFPLIGPSEISSISLTTLKSEVSSGRMGARMGEQDRFVDRNRSLMWPNKLGRAPPGLGDFIVVPDGFLPPGKSEGDLFLARADGTIHKISVTKPSTFYHEVEWHDFNGDGLLDILTVRCTKFGSVFSGFSFTGEMVWMENPGKAQMDQVVWTEHHIADGPDVIFKSIPGPNGGRAVFATEFFNQAGPRLTVHMLHANGTRYADAVIDTDEGGMGKPFAVDIDDIDGDGVNELLVTNHQGPDDEILPAIFAYEVNWDDLTGPARSYKRHTLTYGPSENKVNNPGVGAPGFAHAFYPAAGMSGPKYIFAAGDGAFDVWILIPKQGERFGYETKLVDIGGTTGEILRYDFDGDGIQDLLVPDNDFWGLHVVTFE